MSNIRIRAEANGGKTTVAALITHPMETGLRQDAESGDTIPAHFIKELVCRWKDEIVLNAQWSGGVSQNPYLSFRFHGGEPGDAIEIAWTDNLGQTGAGTATIR
ncbi:thiosulfate oxidation carrier complex protein SoxZ [Thioalkalicoccus limnaeus]|uniref:Thiosulfate oxidation carrier complex protein SoxZ n=1 Tax=Thioalkalicoccus limnaeus TaxID=120681 RepID=A0ABV4B9T3_9GAMM